MASIHPEKKKRRGQQQRKSINAGPWSDTQTQTLIECDLKKMGRKKHSGSQYSSNK